MDRQVQNLVPICRCAVEFCSSQDPAKKKESYFYNFPRKPALLKKWMEACSLSEPLDEDEAQNMFVCSTHFRNRDFKKKCFFNTWELKDGVWPSKNLGDIFIAPPTEEKQSLMDSIQGILKNLTFQKKHQRFRDYEDDEYEDPFEDDEEDELTPSKKRKISFNEKVAVRTYCIDKKKELNSEHKKPIEKPEKNHFMYGFHMYMI